MSGGEDGARYGPSLMPGGHTEAWQHIKPIFQGIAAKVGTEPCCDWVGEDGAGHYVKMVHNGIEYGDMQVRLASQLEYGYIEQYVYNHSICRKVWETKHMYVKQW